MTNETQEQLNHVILHLLAAKRLIDKVNAENNNMVLSVNYGASHGTLGIQFYEVEGLCAVADDIKAFDFDKQYIELYRDFTDNVRAFKLVEKVEKKEKQDKQEEVEEIAPF